jgi:hypothetical protein
MGTSKRNLYMHVCAVHRRTTTFTHARHREDVIVLRAQICAVYAAGRRTLASRKAGEAGEHMHDREVNEDIHRSLEDGSWHAFPRERGAANEYHTPMMLVDMGKVSEWRSDRGCFEKDERGSGYAYHARLLHQKCVERTKQWFATTEKGTPTQAASAPRTMPLCDNQTVKPASRETSPSGPKGAFDTYLCSLQQREPSQLFQ